MWAPSLSDSSRRTSDALNCRPLISRMGSFLIRQFDFGVHPSAELKWFGPVVKGAAHAECIRSHMGYAVQGVYRSNVDERRYRDLDVLGGPVLGLQSDRLGIVVAREDHGT